MCLILQAGFDCDNYLLSFLEHEGCPQSKSGLGYELVGFSILCYLDGVRLFHVFEGNPCFGSIFPFHAHEPNLCSVLA